MRLVMTCALALAVAACGEKSPTPQEVATNETPAAKSAGDVVDSFKAAGLNVTNVKVVTEADDGNNLLGRPGQYKSKVFFYDARHPRSPDGNDEGENTVEFFASPSDAKTRHDYIDGVTKGVPMLLQYQILHGNVLARFDKVMLPSEVEEYKKVVDQLKVQ